MSSEKLNSYITRRYNSWLDYASYHCRRSGLNLEPAEVLNDVLCQLMQKNPAKLEKLLHERTGHHSIFDCMVWRRLRMNIYLPHSHHRYTKGQHCTQTVCSEIEKYPDAQITDPEDANTDSRYSQVRVLLEGLDVPVIDKQIFEWRFFEGKSYAEWSGPGSQKFFYDRFNKIFSLISSQIRLKKGN